MADLTRYINILRGSEYFRQNLPKFKEAFIKFYGEENREYIEEQFANASFFTVISPTTVKMLLGKIHNLICYDLIDETIMTSGYEFTREDITGDNTYNFPHLKPIEYFIEMYEAVKAGREQREKAFYEEGFEFVKGYFKEVTREQYDRFLSRESLPEGFDKLPEVIKSNLLFYRDKDNVDYRLRRYFQNCEGIIKKIDVNITFEELEDYLEDLEEVYELFKDAISRYSEVIEPFSDSIKRAEQFDTIKRNVNVKYHRLLVKENIDLIPEEDREKALKYINGKASFFDIGEISNNIFGFSIDGSILISAFSTESSELLNNPNTTQWRIESICKDRVKFFRCLGIDHGDDYSSYLSDPKVIELIKKYNFIADKIESDQRRLKEEYYKELATLYDRHVEIRSEIDELNLLNKDDCFGPNLYAGLTPSNTFVSPNVQMTDEGIRMFNLIAIGLDYYDDGYVDHIICHELNHLYELDITSVDKDGFDFCCGWDRGRIDYSSDATTVTNDTDKRRRGYELFNEIINELLAQEVSQIMINDGSIIYDDPSKVKYRGFTSYEHTRVLVIEFLKEFREEILQSRRHGNYQLILDTVGEENFDALNELVIEFTENFSGFKFYSLMDAKKKEEENDLTRLFDSFIARRDEILTRMKEYREKKRTGQSPHI